MFGQFLCPSSGVFHCTHSNGIWHTVTVCEQDQDGTYWSCSQTVGKPVWHIPLLCVQWKIPDDGQKNCPKHVEFYSKNKFEKLVHLVGFIIRIYHDARSPERQTPKHFHRFLWTDTSCLSFLSRRWRQLIHPRYWYPRSRPHCFVIRKTTVQVATTVKFSDIWKVLNEIS